MKTTTKITKLARTLLFTALIALLYTNAFSQTCIPRFVTGIGTRGSGSGQFKFASGVAITATGNIYVVDRGNNRIQKFDANGNYLLQWGTFGTGNGQFSGPFGVALDALGNVYVTDTSNSRIQKFTANGTFLTKWGTFGTGNGQFVLPTGIASDRMGNIYVVDNEGVQKFDESGTFIRRWGNPAGLTDPNGIAATSDGYVYVSYSPNLRSGAVFKFDTQGNVIARLGTPGQFPNPRGLAVDAVGNLYVSDGIGNSLDFNIKQFRRDGSFALQFGADAQESEASYGIAINSAGKIFAIKSVRLLKFACNPAEPALNELLLAFERFALQSGLPNDKYFTMREYLNLALTDSTHEKFAQACADLNGFEMYLDRLQYDNTVPGADYTLLRAQVRSVRLVLGCP